jgi:hypothetical protein
MYTAESDSLRGDRPRINNYKPFNISPMKTKFHITDPKPVCLVHAVSASAAIPPAILAAASANTERRVGLCLQVEGNQLLLVHRP